MRYVYILSSEAEPGKHYVGLATDQKARITAHNNGQSRHTAKLRPWKLHWYAAFTDDASARAFEAYLKTGSGRRFQKRHLGLL